MVKKGLLRKIAALTAALAMIGSFAVCASAVNVSTTTQYVTGNEAKVNVIANVSGLDGADYVTYYATKGGTPVYVDQKEVSSGAARFEYVTAATNLNGDVKVGYTDGDAAENANIDGYIVKINGTNVDVIPTLPASQTVVLDYNVGEGKDVAVNAEGATAAYIDHDADSITVTLSAFTAKTVEITATITDKENLNATGSFIASGAVVVGNYFDKVNGEDYAVNAGARKVTVLAKVTGSNDYGVIISKTAITTGEKIAALPTGAFYKAVDNDANGYFAVQVIDEGADTAEDALIQSGVSYNTAVYYKTADGYTVVAGNAVTAQ